MDQKVQERINSLKEKVKKNPGDPSFVELAALLGFSSSTRPEARDICFKGLTINHNNLKGRLLLSKLFFLDKMYDFSLRELIAIRKYKSSKPLEDLISAVKPYAKFVVDTGSDANITNEESTIAEFDVEI